MDNKICNDELYESTARQTGVDIKLVKEIIHAYSSFTKQVVEIGAFESVTIPYLGKIKAKLKKVQDTNNAKGRNKK